MGGGYSKAAPTAPALAVPALSHAIFCRFRVATVRSRGACHLIDSTGQSRQVADPAQREK